MTLILALLGDKGTGKTSLVTRWCAELDVRAHSAAHTDCFRQITINAQTIGGEEDVRIVDTRSTDRQTCNPIVQFADAVLIVSAHDQPESTMNVYEKWIPLVREKRPSVPLIHVLNKSDKETTQESKTTPGLDSTQKIIEKFNERDVSVVSCTCLSNRSAQRALRLAIKAAHSPKGVLVDVDQGTGKIAMSLPFCKALSHIFRKYDRDQDGLLDAQECLDFVNELCLYSSYADVDQMPGFGAEAKDFEWFLSIFHNLTVSCEPARTWSFLKAKGFNRFLQLASANFQDNCSSKGTYYLTAKAIAFLKVIYKGFEEKDGQGLSPDGATWALFPCPVNPFEDFEFMDHYHTLTCQQWLSRWGLLATCRPKVARAALLYLGYGEYEGPPLEGDGRRDKVPHVVRLLCISLDQRGKQNQQGLIEEMKKEASVLQAQAHSRFQICATFARPLKQYEHTKGKAESTSSANKTKSGTRKRRKERRRGDGDGGNTMADSSYYFFKSTPKEQASRYAPQPIKPGDPVPLETPRVPLNSASQSGSTSVPVDNKKKEEKEYQADALKLAMERKRWAAMGGFPRKSASLSSLGERSDEVRTSATADAKDHLMSSEGPLLVIQFQKTIFKASEGLPKNIKNYDAVIACMDRGATSSKSIRALASAPWVTIIMQEPKQDAAFTLPRELQNKSRVIYTPLGGIDSFARELVLTVAQSRKKTFNWLRWAAGAGVVCLALAVGSGGAVALANMLEQAGRRSSKPRRRREIEPWWKTEEDPLKIAMERRRKALSQSN